MATPSGATRRLICCTTQFVCRSAARNAVAFLPLPRSTPHPLLQRAVFLVFDLQIVHHLLHIGHSARHCFRSVALGLRTHTRSFQLRSHLSRSEKALLSP